MKKLAAIFFLMLFSFNWFGYQLLFDYLQQKSSEETEALLDCDQYNESQLIELKIALHVPYQTTRADFERFNGEIELNGKVFKYVKRKVINDTLYVMCIPDSKRMKLESVKYNFFKISTDFGNEKMHSGDVSKSMQITCYLSSIQPAIMLPCPLYEKSWVPLLPKNLLTANHLSPEQPPDKQTA